MSAEAVIGAVTLCVGAIVWFVRLEGRVNTTEQRHEDTREDIKYIRERIDKALDKTLVVACALLLGTAAVGAQSWPALMPAAQTSVLRIESQNEDTGRGGTCSGPVVNVKAGYVLTAAHCVPTGARPSLTVASQHAEVARVNRLLDLAVLRTELPKGTTAMVLAPAPPPAGTPVAILGYGFGTRDLVIQVGVIAHPKESRTQMTWVNGDLLPGDSGGAIVDGQGRLVGITSGFLFFFAAHIGQAVPLETVRAFVAPYLPVPAAVTK
jgi:S1-C subfamily serine protease